MIGLETCYICQVFKIIPIPGVEISPGQLEETHYYRPNGFFRIVPLQYVVGESPSLKYEVDKIAKITLLSYSLDYGNFCPWAFDYFPPRYVS